MTQEDKQLLLKDLCARLPHGVKVETPYDKNYYSSAKLVGIRKDIEEYIDIVTDKATYPIRFIKPYLRPMSSMTDEEYVEFQKTVKVIQDVERTLHWCHTRKSYDWLDKKMFDYRGLIDKGLALEAPKGMYN